MTNHFCASKNTHEDETFHLKKEGLPDSEGRAQNLVRFPCACFSANSRCDNVTQAFAFRAILRVPYACIGAFLCGFPARRKA
jgi:hypothetical protein